MFTLLLKHGADMNLCDKKERTVLHHPIAVADLQRSENTIIEALSELLVLSDLDIQATDEEGHTAEWYTKDGGFEVVSELLACHQACTEAGSLDGGQWKSSGFGFLLFS